MGSLLEFVNAIADAVAREHPGVKVGTLSYWYTRKPPRTIKPRPNVQIQLCSIECCVVHPINDPACEKNRRFCSDMAAWGKLTDNIFIWNYNTNFSNYLLPFPNLRVIGPNVRYFVKNGAKNYEIIPDRKAAIRKALSLAEKGDYVLVAGKGHEDYQVLKDGTIPFSDIAVIKALLEEMRGA